MPTDGEMFVILALLAVPSFAVMFRVWEWL
jgi:hypothetical protein